MIKKQPRCPRLAKPKTPITSIAELQQAVEKAWDNAPNKNGYEIYEETKKAISEFEASVRDELKIVEGCPVTDDNKSALELNAKLLRGILDGEGC